MNTASGSVLADQGTQASAHDYLRDLNPAQRKAVEHGIADNKIPGPLLIVAGAGTGKTNTLAHRFAHLVLKGADPRRILLLTFTRRAAAEMTRRVQRILARTLDTRGSAAGDLGTLWAGTFHAIGNRLLRLYAGAIGLDPSFTVLDRSDAADLINLVRHDLGFAKKRSRFPKKDTCIAAYSYAVNARTALARGDLEQIGTSALERLAECTARVKRLKANLSRTPQSRAKT